MSPKAGRIICALAAALLLVPATGCVCGGPSVALTDLETEHRTVELGGAERVVVRIDMGIGEFAITGGADALLEGEFRYNVEEWKPVVDYSVNGDVGRLTIKQSSHSSKSVPDGARNEWDLALSENVPMEIELEMGVGKAEFELGGLMLTDLDVDHGVGELVLDLVGDWTNDLDANIDGGVGRIRLTVPSSAGVRVDTNTGIGSIETTGLTKQGGAFVNDAYGESGTTLDISVDAGIGGITIQVSDDGGRSI